MLQDGHRVLNALSWISDYYDYNGKAITMFIGVFFFVDISNPVRYTYFLFSIESYYLYKY